ncbi:MAG: ribosome biogenesis GTP-binding protein YsxC [Oligoflexales bacterium]|nr:ribosome biogenesis GTP-binding protein YsxC [Oligoflexales bacterium]
MHSEYITSARWKDQLPLYSLPEVAFLGRSNCGKSSLLNALLGRKNLAKTSSTPGRTQMVNFFSVLVNKEKSMIFVDLPGWGYHEASYKTQVNWEPLLEAYLERENLRDFLFLFDVRRELEPFEWNYVKFLSSKNACIVWVLTKTDKVKPAFLHQKIEEIKKQCYEQRIPYQEIFPISSLTKAGIEQLQTYIFRDPPVPIPNTPTPEA